MDIKKLFPNKYLSGDDLGGRAHVVKIARIVSEKMPAKTNADEEGEGGTEVKWVVYFVDRKAGRVLNKTVAYQLAEALGSTDTDRWIGQWIEVYPVSIRAFGKRKNVAQFRKASKIPTEKQPEPSAAIVDQQTGEVVSDGQPPA